MILKKYIFLTESKFSNTPGETGGSVFLDLSSNKLPVFPHCQRRCNTDRPELAGQRPLLSLVWHQEGLANKKVRFRFKKT